MPIRSYAHRLACRLAVGLAAVLLAAGPAAAQQTLTDALAMAYASNPTLAAARAELRAVNEQVPQELSAWRPRVTVTGDVGKQHIERKDLNSSEGTTPRAVELDVTQSLYRGGRTVAGTKRAEAEIMAQRARLLDTEQFVLLSALIAYIDVWRDQSVLNLTQNNEQVLTRQLEATRDRFEVGEITRTDVAQSESRLAGAIGDRVAAEGTLAISRATYQEVIGIGPGVLDQPPPLKDLPAAVDAVIDGSQQRNPLILAARFSEDAARKNERVQFGQLLPEVAVVGSLTRSQETTSSDSDLEQAQILAQVTVPIYQQGFVSSQIREAKQRSSQRRLQIDEARRAAVQDSISAWEALQTARAEIEAFQSQVRATEIALEGVRQENAVGARTILDILDAEQELLDARVSLVLAQRDEIVAGYQVLAAMGRLTATELGLPVETYDPDIDLDAVRNVWYGFGDIP